MLNERVDLFAEEVNKGTGKISIENANLLWKVLFDQDITLNERQAIKSLENHNRDKMVSEEIELVKCFDKDDIFIEYQHLYNGKELLLIVDLEGTIKIARRPKISSDPIYSEHGDYVYKHAIPTRLLKLIITKEGKLGDNKDVLNLLPSEVRSSLSSINIEDFQKLAIESFKRPLQRKFYYIIFSKGEKTSIKRYYTDDEAWNVIKNVCNRDTYTFQYDYVSSKLHYKHTEYFTVVITNEEYLISRYRFCMTYEEFKLIFLPILYSDEENYLTRVWNSEIDSAYQVNGSTSIQDDGQTYYCDDYLVWKEA